jgi:hypothetical protein
MMRAGRLLAMAEHKFKIGQVVYIQNAKVRAALQASSGGYVVTRRLPEKDGEFQYAIRSAHEDHERVVTESEISRF